jgi:hypothetical protein
VGLVPVDGTFNDGGNSVVAQISQRVASWQQNTQLHVFQLYTREKASNGQGV